MPYSRRQMIKGLSAGGASLAMAPFMHSLHAHAEGKEEALPKRFVFVVKSSGIEHAANSLSGGNLQKLIV